MARHPAQQSNHARPFNPKTPPGVVHVEPSTAKRDAEALERMQAGRIRKPPHRHQWSKGVCRICSEPEVEST